jgi:integral membrane sensor domain MASE1
VAELLPWLVRPWVRPHAPPPGQEVLGGSAARRFERGYLLGVAEIILAYYVAAHIGYAFQFAGPVAAVVWLPVGVGIAALYLGGLRFWPAVLLGDLLVNNYSTLPIGCAVAQSFGNLLEILVAAGLIRRLRPRGAPLETVGGTAVVVAGITAGTAVSAAIGALSLSIWGVVHEGSLLRVWRTWWLGDFSGALIILPLAIAWWNQESRDWLRGRGVEGAALLVALIGLSQFGLNTGSPLSYIVFPALIWAALRFGPRGATLAILVVLGFAIWGTTHFNGPFAFHWISRGVLATQLYIAVAALSTLTLTAVVCERRALDAGLRASRLRLIAAGQIGQRRLERDLHDGAQQRLIALAVHLRGPPGQRRVGQGLIARTGPARRGSGRALACHRRVARARARHPPADSGPVRACRRGQGDRRLGQRTGARPRHTEAAAR